MPALRRSEVRIPSAPPGSPFERSRVPGTAGSILRGRPALGLKNSSTPCTPPRKAAALCPILEQISGTEKQRARGGQTKDPDHVSQFHIRSASGSSHSAFVRVATEPLCRQALQERPQAAVRTPWCRRPLLFFIRVLSELHTRAASCCQYGRLSPPRQRSQEGGYTPGLEFVFREGLEH